MDESRVLSSAAAIISPAQRKPHGAPVLSPAGEPPPAPRSGWSPTSQSAAPWLPGNGVSEFRHIAFCAPLARMLQIPQHDLDQTRRFERATGRALSSKGSQDQSMLTPQLYMMDPSYLTRRGTQNVVCFYQAGSTPRRGTRWRRPGARATCRRLWCRASTWVGPSQR